MQPLQIQDDRSLVEASFQRVAPAADALVERFYTDLFVRAPRLRPLFRGDLAEQRKKLVAALALAVGHLRKAEVLAPVLIELGRKHAAYGVEEAHFALVGSSLLSALSAADPGWDDATRTAWSRVFGVISQLMCTGLRAGRSASEGALRRQ